ncbi:hypothetical protein AVEN_236045-1 [Araneus ventricosus]|uniref:Uncharacterized protein n=1 Tax=Araneus ventricosus TaxID=182803 RepID=A0A4Y2I4K8_ARAVE|nr:hypothetical protein AVEN_236045-1 [Araneus ventricosus]
MIWSLKEKSQILHFELYKVLSVALGVAYCKAVAVVPEGEIAVFSIEKLKNHLLSRIKWPVFGKGFLKSVNCAEEILKSYRHGTYDLIIVLQKQMERRLYGNRQILQLELQRGLLSSSVWLTAKLLLFPEVRLYFDLSL